jgi:hypothetical protein
MSFGIKNFTLVSTDNNADLFLDTLWSNIQHGKLPLPNDDIEKYSFHLAHDYKPVCDFEWMDYPGGILADPNHKFRPQLDSSISSADCILLILDGKLFKIEAANEEEYKRKLANKLRNSDLKYETKYFTQMSAKGEALPPILIVVTKSDLINPEYQEAIEQVIRQELAPVFAGAEEKKGDRMVLMTTVSLGDNFDHGGEVEPYNIEQPIAFAVLVILIKYMLMLKAVKQDNLSVAQKKHSKIGRFFNSDAIEKAERNLVELSKLSDKCSKDAYRLLELFPDTKSIYINNDKTNMREYFRDLFVGLNK